MSLKKPLIVVKHPKEISKQTLSELEEYTQVMSSSLDADVVLMSELYEVAVHDNSLHESINNMAQRITELVESNDRLTKALIDSYNEPEGEEVPRTYMDGTKVK